jgi:prophage regulatory protein
VLEVVSELRDTSRVHGAQKDVSRLGLNPQTARKIWVMKPLPTFHMTPTDTTIPHFDQLPDNAFVRESQLVRSPKHPARPVPLQFSPSTLWRAVRAKTFPQPIKLSERVTAWRVGDVRAWMQRQLSASCALA